MSIQKKLLEHSNISQLQEKIEERLKNNRLVFGNRIQSAEIKILNIIDIVLNDTDNFIECEACQKLYFKDKIREIEGGFYCEECISNIFSNCEACGEYIYNDDIHILNDCECYCQQCYFKEKQKIYNSYELKNQKLIELKNLCKKEGYNILFEYELKIDSHIWDIEKHGEYYRIGSWGANSWIDIGSNKKSLLEAIEYNLKSNISLLTDIRKK